MENTGNALFSDDTARWYIAVGENWIGPLSAEAVYKKIVDQEMTWAHYVWKQGQANWTRLCDTAEFQSVVPVQPQAKPQIKTAKPAFERAEAKLSPADRPWFLYYQSAQSGPFSEAEVKESLLSGRISGKVHVWRDGMGAWEKIEKSEAFRAVALSLEKNSIKPPQPEQRTAPRRPLVARIFVANEKELVIGVCRDISVGGMQVLTDKIPGNVGALIKMNVSPAQVESESQKIEPFVAQGRIVRLIEDHRGFSFRFEKLSEPAKQAIEDYLRSDSPTDSQVDA